ncbi:MAG: pseudaminic acid synthase [Bdellovibrionales bacterium]|nr:pseudaminic acid synthase [Bdellovibrionales bacterium]
MSAKVIRLGKTQVGEGAPPYVIAEMSANHNQSLDRAFELIDAAANAGCHAVKIQTYTADTMTLDCDRPEFRIEDKGSLWTGRTLYDLYQEAHTPWEWHKPIFERCRERGLDYFSTPFDHSAVDLLEELQVPFYKIASFENTDIPLLRKVAKTGKPVIFSNGMATVQELAEAVQTIRDCGNDQIAILKCTSTYPATPKDSNLATIPHLRELFDVVVGLSDHTLGIGVPVASVALGASIIEKHFTLARSDGGPDSAFSLEPSEMKMLVEESLRAYESIGVIHYGLTEKEKKSLCFRRSLFACCDIKEGEVLNAENVRIIRPGMGLAPKFSEFVWGRTAARDIQRGTPITFELIS